MSVRWRASDEGAVDPQQEAIRDKINKLDSELEKSGTEKLLADKFKRNMKKKENSDPAKGLRIKSENKGHYQGSELKEIRHEGEGTCPPTNEEDLKNFNSREMERQRERMNLNLEIERKRSEIESKKRRQDRDRCRKASHLRGTGN